MLGYFNSTVQQSVPITFDQYFPRMGQKPPSVMFDLEKLLLLLHGIRRLYIIIADYFVLLIALQSFLQSTNNVSMFCFHSFLQDDITYTGPCMYQIYSVIKCMQVISLLIYCIRLLCGIWDIDNKSMKDCNIFTNNFLDKTVNIKLLPQKTVPELSQQFKFYFNFRTV